MVILPADLLVTQQKQLCAVVIFRILWNFKLHITRAYVGQKKCIGSRKNPRFLLDSFKPESQTPTGHSSCYDNKRHALEMEALNN